MFKNIKKVSFVYFSEFLQFVSNSWKSNIFRVLKTESCIDSAIAHFVWQMLKQSYNMVMIGLPFLLPCFTFSLAISILLMIETWPIGFSLKMKLKCQNSNSMPKL